MKPAILDRLKGVKRSGQGWLAFCPAHADRDRQSLSISHADGRTLAHCFAGCTPEQIVAAVSMTLADLFSENGTRSQRTIVATYDYRDGAGTVLYQAVRYAPKDFRQRRPDGQGGWIWNLDGAARVPYRLPDLLEQPRVFWCEGEKDADRVAALGLSATTGAGGAEAWRDDYAQQLTALGVREVVVLPDHDKPGEQYAAAVAAGCQAAGLLVRVLRLPGLRPKGDVSDYLDAGHSREELEALAAATAIYAPPPSGPEPQEPGTTPAPGAGPAGVALVGDDVVLTWADFHVIITAVRHRIRESGGAVRAELNVTRAGRHLHLADLPLASTSSRRTEVKALEELDPDVPWRDVLAHACRVLVEYSRTGDGPAVELIPQMRTEERYAVKPVVLARGATVLCGAGGDGKGYGALTMAYTVVTGTSIAGFVPIRRGTVLYLDWEADQVDQQERLALLAAGFQVLPRGIHYRRMAKPLPDAAAEIRSDIHAIGNVQLIIVDSLMPASGGGDRAWHDVSAAVFGALRTFTPPQLVIAHLSHADAGRPGQGARPFGSVFNMNFPRAVWEWRRAEGAPDELLAGLYHIKANNTAKSAPLGLRYTFEPTPDHPDRVTVQRHDLAQEPDLLARAGLTQGIRLSLKTGALTAAELAERLGANEDSVGRVLRRLADKHQVVKLDGKPAKWGLETR